MKVNDYYLKFVMVITFSWNYRLRKEPFDYQHSFHILVRVKSQFLDYHFNEFHVHKLLTILTQIILMIIDIKTDLFFSMQRLKAFS